MIVTVVTFNAYDKKCTEAFVDKPIDVIHATLNIISNSYVPLEVMNIEVTLDLKKQSTFINVEALNELKREEEKRYKNQKDESL